MGIVEVTKAGKQDIPIVIYVQASRKNDLPSLDIRRTTTNPDLIKFIIRCALTNQPIVIKPEFSNDMISLAKLVEIGILYKKNERYFFTF